MKEKKKEKNSIFSTKANTNSFLCTCPCCLPRDVVPLPLDTQFPSNGGETLSHKRVNM